MFNFLSKNKKGFTIVELVVVLLLLSFGVLALANMFKVTYRAFQKAEERSIKQEAVKTVAELLRSGSNNVAAAATADVFGMVDVVPNGDAVDDAYSYLFAEQHYACSKCEEDWNVKDNVCTSATCSGGSKKCDGYYLYILNKGVEREDARLLSDVPIYATIKIFEDKSYEAAEVYENQCGVVITLAALEDDFEYLGNPPTSDDMYYSLDVAYHFPNMVTKDMGGTVNYITKDTLSSANRYKADGTLESSIRAVECHDTSVSNSNGKLSYIKCTPDHCGQSCGITKDHYCADCNCDCLLKRGTVLRVYVDSILSGDDANTSVDVPSLCFIATASYGQDSGEVGLLCKFRDECLLTNPLGTAFVKAYYKLSPPIADFIRESEPLKAAVRFGLKPLVAIATNALDEDAAAQNAPWFIMFMLCGAGATATLIKVDKRRKKAR